jgi:beta-mannosidase
MPRWPEQDGLEVARLDGFVADGPLSDDAAVTFGLRFAASPPGPGEEVLLALDGVATVFEAVLNGVVVAEGSSMFAAHVADVGALLREEGNHLEIRCRALSEVLAEQPRRPRQRWRTKVVENGGALRFVRTAILGRAPGFAPGPPIVGPWRPVWLVRRRGVVVDDVVLRPRVEGDDGVLAISARLRGTWLPGHAETDGVEQLRGAILPAQVEAFAGPTHAPLRVEPDGFVHGEVRVPDVDRWWPHTHGTPALYDVALVLDGGAQRVDLGRTGFRALSPGPDFDADRDALAPAINGVPVFARGVVWTPVAEDEVVSTLRTLRDAGINMVRIPGIGVPETAAFHDACDMLGLMVWQDFGFANLDYPIEDGVFRATVEDEARALLAQVAGRPSLTVLCGNSEVEQQAAMFGVDPALGRGELFGVLLPRLARAAGGDVPYVPSAPCGGAMPFHPGTGIANYFGVGGYRRPLSDVRAAGVRFASECLAFANLPDGDAVADGEGVARDVGADWDFADVRDHYLTEMYGLADPGALRAADRERYLALGRQVSGEAMAFVFGEWRRGASGCAGGIVLWARDLVPGAGWGLLDHTGAPKVALAHLRRALAPRAVWLVDEGLNGVDAHVVNDRHEPLDAALHVALLAGGTHTIAEATTTLHLAAHTNATHNVEALLGHFADPAYAYRFGPPAHDTIVATLRTTDGMILSQATHFPTGPPLEPTTDLGLHASVTSVTGPDPVPKEPHARSSAADARTSVGGPDPVPKEPLARSSVASRDRSDAVAVEVATERLAWGVRIDAPGFRAEDDAFVVVPGMPRTVRLWPLVAGASLEGAAVTALNLIGETPIGTADMAA